MDKGLEAEATALLSAQPVVFKDGVLCVANVSTPALLGWCGKAAITLQALLAALRDAEKDAERYRWLRDIGPFRPFGHCVANSDGNILTSGELDTAIDAALTEAKP